MSFARLRLVGKSNRRIHAMKISFPNHRPLLSPGINAKFCLLPHPSCASFSRRMQRERKSRLQVQILPGTLRQGDTRENAFRTFSALSSQTFWRIQKEVRSDGVNTIDTADYLVIRSRAEVALQQKLGICAQRRHRFSSGNSAYSAAAACSLGQHDLMMN